MHTKTQQFILIAEVFALLFLAFRGVIWLIDHTTGHHLLDTLTGAVACLLIVLFALAKPVSKSQKRVQLVSAWVITVVGVGLLAATLAGTGAALYFLGR